MQRRLIVALVGIALSAVLLVGAGVLILAQVGARDDAETDIARQLSAVAGLVDRAEGIDELRSLEAARTAFGLADLDFVYITTDGSAHRLAREQFSGRPRARGIPVTEDVAFTLTPEQRDALGSGELVVFDGVSGNRSVVGVQEIRFDSIALENGASIAIMGEQGVVTIGRQARMWFLASTMVVLVGSMIAAWLLARRLSKPIRAIERATSEIAAGNFTVQVDASGDDELADLGRSVNRMAKDLERSKALDQQFLMSISHDLRTPLTAIAGYAEALRDGAVAANEAAHAGEVIGNHADRLERLVGDLLDLARLDANRFTLDLQPLDVGVAVGRTVAGLLPQAEQHGLEPTFDHEGTIVAAADPHRLAQVVGNVMENAIKFARSAIVASVTAEGDQAVIVVDDDGPGIAAKDLPHVFERLYVSKSQPERAENPTGMGLAIVRELMTAMGGTVEAASGPGRGTTMTLRLPLAAPVGVAPPSGRAGVGRPDVGPATRLLES